MHRLVAEGLEAALTYYAYLRANSLAFLMSEVWVEVPNHILVETHTDRLFELGGVGVSARL